MPAQRRALDDERQRAVGRRRARAPICASGSTIAAHRPARERLVADELEAARPGRRGCRRSAGRASRRCRSRSAPPARAGRAGRRRGRRACRRPSSSTCDAERAHGAERRLGVARAAEAADARLAFGQRADQQRAVGDRLVARDADVAVDAARPAQPSSSTADDDDAVALRLEQRRRAARLVLAGRRAASPCRRARARCAASSKSSMLIRSAPSACVIPAKTPGRSGTCTRSRCSVARVGVRALEHPPAVAGRLADPAREEAGVAARRAPPRPARPAGGARRAPRGAPRALSRKMSTQIRGFAPATRVMSRSEPPALASGSWPSIARSRRPG